MLIGRIRLACLTLESSVYWGQEIRNVVLLINTRFIRVQGYTLAEILCGFNPAITRKAQPGFEEWAKRALATGEAPTTATESWINSHMDGRDERGRWATERLAQRHDNSSCHMTSAY